ncbi:hypothetical protein H1C71_006102 [Ictidomys tridecemlineatus]|nr:hypothetical protein H1C71_006102 [Ictidomys tridecemlineatus]
MTGGGLTRLGPSELLSLEMELNTEQPPGQQRTEEQVVRCLALGLRDCGVRARVTISHPVPPDLCILGFNQLGMENVLEKNVPACTECAQAFSYHHSLNKAV